MEQFSSCTTTAEPVSCDYWARVLQLRKPEGPGARAPQKEEPRRLEAYAHRLEKAHAAPKTQQSQKLQQITK